MCLKLKPQKAATPAAPYTNMVVAAMKAFKDKKGSSRQAILKYIVAINKIEADKATVRVQLALKMMVAAKEVVAAAAAGPAVLARRELQVSGCPPRSPRPRRLPSQRRPPRRSKFLPSSPNLTYDLFSCQLSIPAMFMDLGDVYQL